MDYIVEKLVVKRTSGQGDGDNFVLKCREISLPRGGLTFLVGLNGTGKSTFFRGLLGMDCEERKLSGFDAISYVRLVSGGDGYELESTMTVREHAIALDVPPDRLFHLLERHDGSDWSNLQTRLPIELSAGQRQLLTATIQVERKTDLLLVDEASSNLDVNRRSSFFNLLKETVRERGIACVVATHDLGMVPSNAGKCLLASNREVRHVEEDDWRNSNRLFSLVASSESCENGDDG
jgi:ABC-type Mn2+/Zn2+ transport system ATPase subunit